MIGRHGYGGCSISRVTATAGIAKGTFYLYFRSQQQLFDLILPTLGGEMLASIAKAIGDENDTMKVERLGCTANVQYTAEHIYMNRVLTEAQHYAPDVYASFMDGIIKSYVRSLRRTLKYGARHKASDRELSLMATMIVAARTKLLLQIDSRNAKIPGFLDEIIESYLSFVMCGLDL